MNPITSLISARPLTSYKPCSVSKARQPTSTSRATLSLRPSRRPRHSSSRSRSPPGNYNSAGFLVSIPLRLFDRNQGNKETARYQTDASRFTETAARYQVVSDIDQAWVGYTQAKRLSDRFGSHYLDESRDVLSIAQYAFEHGGIALIDYLDSVRDARSSTSDALNAYQNTWLAIHQLSAASATEVLP
jgi:cobalt-zinc-cadmium efflux system outer membrane protein